MPKTVGGLIYDKAFLEFWDAWKRELHGSNREHEYLEFIMLESGFKNSDSFSIIMLRQILNCTIELVTASAPRISHPVAAFELVTIVDDFSQLALKSLPKSAKRQLDKELTCVSASVIIFAFQAIDQYFRASTRLTGN